MKNQRGITLIALVITIIVLLILAGVSIAMLTGENGILNKATTAVDKTEKAEIEEAIKLAIAEILANKLDPTYEGTEDVIDATNIQNLVKRNNSNVTVAVTGSASPLTITAGDYSWTVDTSNGKLTDTTTTE